MLTKKSLFTAICLFLSLNSMALVIDKDTVDLELSSTSLVRKINVQEVATVTFTLKNNSTFPATNINVWVHTPYKEPFSVLESSNASLGAYDSNSNSWTIQSLAAGATASITMNYKILDSGIWYAEAEVFFCDQADPDSKPFNQVDNEDDYTRTCVSVPLVVETTTFPTRQYLINDIKLNSPSWTKDNVVYTNTSSNGNTLLFTSPGSYNFSQTGFKCPSQGCCPFIVEVGVVNTTCCIPLENLMTRTAPELDNSVRRNSIIIQY